MVEESGLIIDAGSGADISALREMDQETGSPVGKSDADYLCVQDSSLRRVVLVSKSVSGEIYGFLVARAVDTEWEIENLVVSASRRRQGLGARLVKHLLREAKAEGAANIHLEVRRLNAPAIALYLRCGFQETGVRKAYYSNPEEDALLFSYSLKNSS